MDEGNVGGCFPQVYVPLHYLRPVGNDRQGGGGYQDFVGVEAHAVEGCLFLKVLLSCIGL